jgi:hypothetical protein
VQAVGWYSVIKTIKGHRYEYLQRTWREGKKVRTESRYIGPAAPEGDGTTPPNERVNTTEEIHSGAGDVENSSSR